MNEKSHLMLLDALRGVAALMVLWFHANEGFGYTIGDGVYTQGCDHGYLAVDFFFLLSGFVIGYAYDDRWGQGLKPMTFFRRRLIRLHPMVVAGALIGMVAFVAMGCLDWNGQQVAAYRVVLATLMGLLLLPAWPGAAADVRANTEMFPLNGPHWSLFFEYIGNILYALLLRRMKTGVLALVSLLSGAVLVYLTLSTGYLGAGWSFADNGWLFGMCRMLFPYTLGMLMARKFCQQAPTHVSGRRFNITFILCSLVIVGVLNMPYVGDPDSVWQNGLYILLLVVGVFPLIVWLAARAGTAPNRLASFLGKMSYPLYAVHYPSMYVFFQLTGYPNTPYRIGDVLPAALGIMALDLVLAYLLMRFYDAPVRKWLTQKFR